MNDLHYSKDEIESILTIFTNNKVKLEFETPNKLVQSLEQISNFCLAKKANEVFQNLSTVFLVEFDVKNKTIISTGVGHPFSSIGFCSYPQLNQQLKIISELFSFHPRSIIDLYSSYMIMYLGDSTEKAEQFYYCIDSGILCDITEDSWDDFLGIFNLSDTTIDFLKQETNYTSLDYIGFDLNNELSKISFSVPRFWFFRRIPENYYVEYIKIDPVLQLIYEYTEKEEIFISLQYSCQNQDYFSVEIQVPPLSLSDLYVKMCDYGIIDEDTLNNFMSMEIPKEYINSVVKFRWATKDNFSVKLYLEKLCN